MRQFEALSNFKWKYILDWSNLRSFSRVLSELFTQNYCKYGSLSALLPLLLDIIIILKKLQIRVSKKRKFRFIIARFLCMHLVFWSWLKENYKSYYFKNYILKLIISISYLKWSDEMDSSAECHNTMLLLVIGLGSTMLSLALLFVGVLFYRW